MSGCAHRNAVDVDLVLTGEVVARLCRDCDAQLPLIHTPRGFTLLYNPANGLPWNCPDGALNLWLSKGFSPVPFT